MRNGCKTVFLLLVAVILVMGLLSLVTSVRRSSQNGGESEAINARGPLSRSDVVLEKVKDSEKLPREVMDNIKSVVFFAGYPRSGHSIVGALLDAHPHIVISHELFLFSRFSVFNRFSEKTWKENFFNMLFSKSVGDATNIRALQEKGYTLTLDSSWQGTYDRYIEVIGDKSGGMTSIEYLEDKEEFKKNYYNLRKRLSIPVRTIHVLRNPFDMIATNMILELQGGGSLQKLKTSANSSKNLIREVPMSKFDFDKLDLLIKEIIYLFSRFEAVTAMINDVIGTENVLEVHNCDLVNDPKGAISRIFKFLEVDATENYLNVCAKKIYRSVSRSRHMIAWTDKQKRMIERKMRKYKMLDRYSFESN